MNVVTQKIGRLLRLSAAAGLLLLGQQAVAVGTDAGTTIDNTAVITYTVNNAAQTPLNADAPQFVVDRVVNFTLDTVNAALTPTAPGENGAIVLYTLTNIGNSPVDFRLVADNLAAGDDDDMEAGTFVSFVDTNSNGVVDAGELDFVDALAEGATVTITVLADAPDIVVNGETALVELTVTAADPGAGINPGPDGALGLDLDDTAPDTAAGIENVFDEDGPGVGGDGVQVFDADGYIFESAVLNIAKASSVYSDPVNGTTSPFAIPGAIIEYTVTISNAGTSATTSLTITDDIQADLNFETVVADYDVGGGENVQIVFTDDSAGTTTTTECVADGNNADGCELAVGGGAGGVDQLIISVPNLDPNDSVDVNFRVMIDNS